MPRVTHRSRIRDRFDAACPDIAAPTAPANLVATSRTATSIALTWSASNDNVGVTGYGLYRGGAMVGTCTEHDRHLHRTRRATRTTRSRSTRTTRRGTAPSKVTVMVSTTACPDTTPSVGSDRPRRLERHGIVAHARLERFDRRHGRHGIRRLQGQHGGCQRPGDVVCSVRPRLRNVIHVRCRRARCRRKLLRHDVPERVRQLRVRRRLGRRRSRTVPPSLPARRGRRPFHRRLILWSSGTRPSGGANNKARRRTPAHRTASPSTCLRALRPRGVRMVWHGRERASTTVRTSRSRRRRLLRTPPSDRRYFDVDSAERRSNSPWTTSSTMPQPGYVDLTTPVVTRTSDGRVKVVPPGWSSGRRSFRDARLRSGWPLDPQSEKSAAAASTQQTFNKSARQVGDVRWFSTRIYLPYTPTEKFEWALGGATAFTLLGLHPDRTRVALRFGFAWCRSRTRQWATWKVYGGRYQSTTSNLE